MANTRGGSVIRVDTSGAVTTGPTVVCGVLYIAGTGTPTASIKAATTSGNLLWETADTVRGFDQVHFKNQDGLYVTLAGTGTVVYIYTK